MRLLKPGLYEQLISKQLQKELDTIPAARKAIGDLDSAEAPKVFAQYVASIVEKRLSEIGEKEGGIEAQAKKKYYVGFENARKQLKEGTKNKELTDLAVTAVDFTESDIVQRNSKMIFDFVDFMHSNSLLSKD